MWWSRDCNGCSDNNCSETNPKKLFSKYIIYYCTSLKIKLFGCYERFLNYPVQLYKVNQYTVLFVMSYKN
jgi:hypothetical protein